MGREVGGVLFERSGQRPACLRTSTSWPLVASVLEGAGTVALILQTEQAVFFWYFSRPC